MITESLRRLRFLVASKTHAEADEANLAYVEVVRTEDSCRLRARHHFVKIINLTIWASRPIVASHLKDDFTRSLFRPFLPGPFKTWHVTPFVNQVDSVMGVQAKCFS
jgi:hypothetical protein